MSTSSSLRERLGLPEQTEGGHRAPSGIRVGVDLDVVESVEKPISLAKVFQRFGLDLAEAHAALNDLKARGHTTIDLWVSADSGPITGLEAYGLSVRKRQGAA